MVNVKKFLVAFLLALVGCAHAQFIGYVSPQTVQQVLASGVTCTGTNQTFPINNLGQTQHWLTVVFAGYNKAQAELDGIDANGNIVRISDILTPTSVAGTAVVAASGYWTKLQMAVTCTSGATVSATYEGGWGAANSAAGGYLLGQVDKSLWVSLAGNTSPSSNVITTPFGSPAGTVYFTFGSSPGVGTLTVTCFAPSTQFTWTFATASVTTTQAFPVPAANCLSLTVAYSGAGTGNTQAEYIFALPGLPPPAYQYSHITTTTATAAKGVTGFLHTLTINLGAAGTVSIFDLPAASCTGTPATNQIAIITATAATLQTFTYDTNLFQGICIKASVAMDLTASFQ